MPCRGKRNLTGRSDEGFARREVDPRLDVWRERDEEEYVKRKM